MHVLGSLIIVTALLGFVFALPMVTRVETDPELTAGFIEGDMVLDSTTRNDLRDEVYRWPNNTVYYRFLTEFGNWGHHNHILHGMKIIESVSCIRFEEAHENITNYVFITGLPAGCFSSVGYLGAGAQTYNLEIYPLDQGCFRLGTIVHEFLHTLGFYHMQSSANRDEYVFINKTNIAEGTLNNFNKYNTTVVDDFDEEYDYGSVLHYSAYAFSANGEMTIVPLKEDEAAGIMGQRRGMSKSDINRLNLMYRCPVKA
ncbi:seminal metalloprotease 1-like [Musca vetustissima]|uniref:seminal metalloprotease 1-like n=1 Tax=Musca vetustissima TaxID=27455 RepID=UPI002AB6CE76|nr:seminal metalloprotease 1-like [Musca vetustissima]